MKKMLMILLIFLLVGCQPKKDLDCLGTFCINAFEYDIEGSLSVIDIDRGKVQFEANLIDDHRSLRNVSIGVFTSDMTYVDSVSAPALHLDLSSSNLQIRGLRPNTEYIARMTGTIIENGKNVSVAIAYVTFTTESFTPVEITGHIDNIRVGETIAVYDMTLEANDHYIVTYGVFLYDGQTVIDAYTLPCDRDFLGTNKENLVFADLDPNKTYTLKLEVIYELETAQENNILHEISFTTK